jgi:5-methylcytosine-specific restriction endonuclease McrA
MNIETDQDLKITSPGWQGMNWIRLNKRQAVYVRDQHKCVYCGITKAKAKAAGILMTLDHLHPRELGGCNSIHNLVTACLVCNCAKQDRPLNQFIEYVKDTHGKHKGIADRVKKQTKLPVYVKSAAGRITKISVVKNSERRERI